MRYYFCFCVLFVFLLIRDISIIILFIIFFLIVDYKMIDLLIGKCV